MIVITGRSKTLKLLLYSNASSPFNKLDMLYAIQLIELVQDTERGSLFKANNINLIVRTRNSRPNDSSW